MRLALALGKTLDELKHMASEELTLWIAFVELDGPFLPQRLDVLTGIQACAASSMAGRTRPADWIPEWGPPKQVDFQTGAEIFAAIFNAQRGR